MRPSSTKLELVFMIKTMIQEMDEDHKKIAKLLKIENKELESIMQLKVRDFTLENLFALINRMGYDISVLVKRSRFDQASITMQRK